MKTLSIEQMEVVQGGRWNGSVGCNSAMIFGAISFIAACASPIGWVAIVGLVATGGSMGISLMTECIYV